MQWCGLWALPGIQKAVPDDFGVVALAGFQHVSRASRPPSLGGWAAQVSAKAKDVEAAKAFVKWLWIDNSEAQEDFNLSYGFHVPPRKSLAAKAEKLKTGPAADALKIFNEFAVPSNPNWTPKMNSAYADAATASSVKAAMSTRTWPSARRRSTPSSNASSAEMSTSTAATATHDAAPGSSHQSVVASVG